MSDNIAINDQEAVAVENGDENEPVANTKDSYYTEGSNEVATETALTLKRLETVRCRYCPTRNCN